MTTPFMQPSAIEAIQNHFAEAAIKIRASGQEVSPQLFAVKTSAVGRIERMFRFDPQTVARCYGSDTEKDVLAYFMADVLTERSRERTRFGRQYGFRPNVLVQIAEAWQATFAPGEKLSEAPRPSQHPMRKEVLFVNIHTQLGSYPFFYDIVDKPVRHAVRSEFSNGMTYEASGRFCFGSTSDEDGHLVH